MKEQPQMLAPQPFPAKCEEAPAGILQGFRKPGEVGQPRSPAGDGEGTIKMLLRVSTILFWSKQRDFASYS